MSKGHRMGRLAWIYLYVYWMLDQILDRPLLHFIKAWYKHYRTHSLLWLFLNDWRTHDLLHPSVQQELSDVQNFVENLKIWCRKMRIAIECESLTLLWLPGRRCEVSRVGSELREVWPSGRVSQWPAQLHSSVAESPILYDDHNKGSC